MVELSCVRLAICTIINQQTKNGTIFCSQLFSWTSNGPHFGCSNLVIFSFRKMIVRKCNLEHTRTQTAQASIGQYFYNIIILFVWLFFCCFREIQSKRQTTNHQTERKQFIVLLLFVSLLKRLEDDVSLIFWPNKAFSYVK